MDVIREEAAEFASLLTRLKSRTDRSYSALARHLSMNASTLHRYCTGRSFQRTSPWSSGSLNSVEPPGKSARTCTAGGCWRTRNGGDSARPVPGEQSSHG